MTYSTKQRLVDETTEPTKTSNVSFDLKQVNYKDEIDYSKFLESKAFKFWEGEEDLY